MAERATEAHVAGTIALFLAGRYIVNTVQQAQVEASNFHFDHGHWRDGKDNPPRPEQVTYIRLSNGQRFEIIVRELA